MNYIFCLVSLLGAFLLFQIQPVISKFILPWFGGSPGVWTTCMLFFQMVLFGGYSYAHFLSRRKPLTQAGVHVVLLGMALLMLPIVPGAGLKPEGAANPSWQILLLLLATVGLPYFVLSATSPLVQVWYSRVYPNRTPWRLYALSNAGSLTALLTLSDPHRAALGRGVAGVDLVGRLRAVRPVDGRLRRGRMETRHCRGRAPLA